jgi:transcriptional regulator with XRE-family HTH domain
VRATGRYIRKHRTERGLTYAQVAEAMGVHEITVRNWEKSKKALRPLVVLAFKQAVMTRRGTAKVVAPFMRKPKP